MKKKLIAGILLILLTLLTGSTLYLYRWNILRPLHSATLTIDRQHRTFVYHLPEKINPHPQLIIVFHGTTMSARLVQIFTGHEFDELADKEKNTIIVYPQGYQKSWNDCRKNATYPAKREQIDDITFTQQLIGYFRKQYGIDTSAVYAVGYSSGGQLAMKLARQQPQWFKAFAVISANMPAPENDDCTDTRQPVSMIYIAGQQDPVNPYKGGSVILNGQNFGKVLSAEATFLYWLSISRSDKKTTRTIQYPPAGSGRKATAYRIHYNSSITGKQMVFISIRDGGHNIPNRNFRIPVRKLGNMNRDVDAPRIIWDFFNSL